MGAFIARVMLVAALTIAAGPSAHAQTLFSGVVLDPAGAPVEGATVYLTQIATNAQVEFQTPASGRFEFSGFPPGHYRVTSTVSAPFTITLTDGDRLVREIRIPFGPFATTWTIVATSATPTPRAIERPSKSR